MKRQLLCIDIDDVLCEFTDVYLQYLRNHTGLNIKREDIIGSFTEMGITGELMRKFLTSGALKNMKVIEGSRKGIEKLEEKFVCVALTARPAYTQKDTMDWILNNFSYLPLVFTRDKGAYCKKVNAWGLVDDQLRWLNSVERGFAVAQPWNNGYVGARGDWDFIAKHILGLI